MKNNRKIISVMASVAIVSQLLSVDSFITYAETNDITNSSVEAQASTLSQNKITLGGIGCQYHGMHQFQIGFDTSNTNDMKIKIESIVGGDHTFHPYFKDEYITLTLYGNNGEEKQSVTMTGTQAVSETIKKEFDNLDFKYGDYLEIHHQEANGRVKIDGHVKSVTPKDYSQGVSKDDLNYGMFKLTQSGLEYISNKTINDITVEGVGCQGGTHAFKISFDKFKEKLIVKSTAGRDHEINPYFKGKDYVTVQVIRGDGTEVKKVTLKGEDLVSKSEELNGCEFKNGYGLRISHAQAGPNVRVSGYVDYCAGKLDKEINKERLEKATFRAGLNGLYYEEARTYPYDILLKGVGCQEGYHQFKIKFNTRDNVIKIADIIGLGSSGKHEFHQYYGNRKYIEIKLFDKDGKKLKQSVIMKGNDNVSVIANAFDNFKFEYGDLLQIYHDEGGQRFQLISAYGSVKNQDKGLHTYRIDQDDLRLVNNEIIKP